MKQITVFTPTYNRAYMLGKLYASLKKQTSDDFLWLIVDDGSTDNTFELVEKWKKEDKVTIEYHYQENQGMHGAHNTAYKLISTELNVCIDSDDFMPVNAVEKILDFWVGNRSDDVAGIIGLDASTNGHLIGTKLPERKRTTLSGFYANGGKGDKKLVYRTDIVNQYPEYGIYKGERLVPLGSKYTMIDQDYEMLVLNEVLCVVEYQEDGSSNTIFRQYKQSPRGFAEARQIAMKYGVGFKNRFKAAVHYVSSAIFSGDLMLLTKSPKPLLTFMAIPFGVLLNLYVRYKIRKI